MATDTTNSVEVQRANEIWADYQRTHDVTPFDGQSVAVDPETDEVFFGPSGYQITRRVTPPGRPRPIVIVRVNSADERYLSYRSGGRRWRRVS